MTKDEEDFRQKLEKDTEFDPRTIDWILEDYKEKKKEKIQEIERKELQDEYDERRPIVKRLRHRFRRITEATGIPTEWVNTFAKSGKKPYTDGWTVNECGIKINGITVYGNPANRIETIDNCIEELVNSISHHRRHIKANWSELAKNPTIIYTEFDPRYLNQITGVCKDRLYKKIKAEIPKAKKQQQAFQGVYIDSEKKNLETFIRKWRANAKKEARENFSRIKGDVDVEEFKSIYQVKKEHPLSKLISQKNGQSYFKRTKMEGETIEFKDSFYANLERVEEEWDDIQNDEKRKGSVPKTIEEWMKIKDENVQFGILKCVCAFLNTKGGTIWLGVNDSDGKIIGVSNVKKRELFQRDGKPISDREIIDAIDLSIAEGLKNHFRDYMSNIGRKYHVTPDGQYLYAITVEPTYPAEVYMMHNGLEIPFVRVGSSSTPYKWPDFTRYAKKRGDKAPRKKKS